MTKVFISIINFNGRKNTLSCLNSIKEINRDLYDLSVVVLDNGSKEEFNVQESDFKDIKLKVIKSEVNLGFSGGHNKIIEYALKNRSDFVLVLNNDTEVDKNLISQLLKTVQDGVGITVPKIYFYPGFEFHKDRYKKDDLGKVFWYTGGKMDWKNVVGYHRGVDEVDHGQYEKIEETDFASGCCFLIKREVLEKVGLFDEKYFLYYEDNDLSQRVKRKGFKIIYNPKAILWHKNAGSVGGSGSYLQDYYITRNRMLFGIKYAPLRSKLALIKESFKILINGRLWQKRGILDFYLMNLEKGSFNI